MVSGNRAAPAGAEPGTGDAIICFSRGTMIRTPRGERRIEQLSQGDLVVTLDGGPQPIRWIGSRSVAATGRLAPVRFARGTIGNERDLFVSPHHRMLLSGYQARHATGRDEVLAPALALVDDFRVSIAYGGMVTYHHMMFDRHQIVFANGAPSESFHPGEFGIDTIDARGRDSLFSVFPALRADTRAYGRPSRPCIGMKETRNLAVG